MNKIALLLSGGVDSSVAALQLVQQGYKPTLFYIVIGPNEKFDGYDCSMEEDMEMCKWIANRLDLTLEIVNLHEEYWKKVMEYHLNSLVNGLTPNPDVLCNRLIKFGAFNDKFANDFDIIATGHYANVIEDNNLKWLATAKDHNKDQTYFLANISYSQLSKALFPLANLTKNEVKNIAKEHDFPTSMRKESMGICFIGKNNYDTFIKSRLGVLKGEIIDINTNKVLGYHNGHWFYTIGQRKGLGLAGGPWFVIKKDIEKNIVYVARGYEPEEVYKKIINFKNFEFITPSTEKILLDNTDIYFKIRHTPIFTKGIIHWTSDKQGYIESTNYIHGVAAGQYVVVYDIEMNKVLGAGVIELT
jgi:tRNA-specific 2-thiouridylase